MIGRYVADCARRFLGGYRERARELLLLPVRPAPLLAGYGAGGPGLRGTAFELLVRTAELTGLGLLVQCLDAGFNGRRYRRLSPGESAFAKTYFGVDELRGVWLDAGSARIAARLRIAFVLGDVIKCGHEPPPTVLVHELVHVRQFRRWGWAYVAKALHAQHLGAGYRYTTAPFNAEQEAAQLEDRARVRARLAPRYLA